MQWTFRSRIAMKQMEKTKKSQRPFNTQCHDSGSKSQSERRHQVYKSPPFQTSSVATVPGNVVLKYHYMTNYSSSSLLLHLLLRHLHRLLLQNLLHSGPLHKSVMPLPTHGKLPLPALLHKLLAHQKPQHRIPRHKHQIRIRDLLPHQIRLIRFCQMRINNSQDASDFVAVAFNG